ncbi:hypothetical protein ACSBR2_001794 [Camellia fascicularis]
MDNSEIYDLRDHWCSESRVSTGGKRRRRKDLRTDKRDSVAASVAGRERWMAVRPSKERSE